MVEKIILVKSSSWEVRFNAREVTLDEVMNHQCDYSFLEINILRCFKTTQKLTSSGMSSDVM